MRAVFLDFDTLGPADTDAQPLRTLLSDLRLYPSTMPEEVAARIRDAGIVMVNKVRLDESVLHDARKLRLICLAATGSDNVDLQSAARRDIAVCNITDYCTPSVAQHVFALLLALTHQLPAYRHVLQAGQWQKSTQFCLLQFPIRELAGKTMGIVGYGTLGQAVADIARAFGMEIVAATLPYRDRVAEPDTGDVRRVPLHELLTICDAVSLHCPLNDETRHLIDGAALQTMKSDAVLINTARGGLVNPVALLEALETGAIAAAGIDVLHHEPPADGDPLLDARLPNLIVTPHIAWAARESRQRAIDEIAANIGSFMKGARRNRLV